MSMTSTETQYLLDMCIKNDRKAQSMLYKKYAGRLFGTCLRYTTGREEAQDILQESFIKIFKHLDQYSGLGSLEGWMKRIVIRTAIQNYRKKNRNLKFEPLPEVENDDWVFSDILERISADEIIRYMQDLPDGYRIVMNLYAIEGYSHKEIAEMLNISEGTSRSQLTRARKYLSDYLETKNYEHG